MPERRPSRALPFLITLAVCAAGTARAVTEPPPEPVRLGLYDWMATAPVVVAADIVTDDARFVKAVARQSFKGTLASGSTLMVDLRQANRDREMGTPALDLEKGRAYLLLLQSSAKGRKEPYPVFDIVRGVRGAKALPAEGSAATIAAVARLADIQSRNNDSFLWATLPDLLEDENPVLVDAALDMYVKFRRESAAIVPLLSFLLEHPRPDFRLRAVLILGRALRRSDAAELPDRPEIVAELTGRARRDDDAAVRREATIALAGLTDAGIDETLRAIARDDTDQNVRFEAEKSLLEREPDAGKRLAD